VTKGEDKTGFGSGRDRETLEGNRITRNSLCDAFIRNQYNSTDIIL
jgi:hypothetical protein